ncbi:hypothetical protein NPX13_g4359 [Xylaria arbuscula]|uniref:Secreted protein n=1 Tax=Xylaria arbuscula TaxID=114810 RepID=A0A9W8TNQ4_9PEZI|nr:hypothetical protein NPX13_g4359 [Xylaria arbuscula]
MIFFYITAANRSTGMLIILIGLLELPLLTTASVGCAGTGTGTAAPVAGVPVFGCCVDKGEQFLSPGGHTELCSGSGAATKGPPPHGYVIVAVIAFGPHTPA